MSGAQAMAAAHMIAAEDMVAYLLVAVGPGTMVTLKGAGGGNSIAARDAIPVFHKIALRKIRAGEIICRGGWPIGRATTDIAPGAHVHTHNLVSAYSTISKETK